MLEGEWLLLGVSVESCGLHQSNHHHVGQSVLERIGDLIVLAILLDVVGPYFASHCGVADNSLSTVRVTHQFSVDGRIESHLAEIQFHFDVIDS